MDAALRPTLRPEHTEHASVATMPVAVQMLKVRATYFLSEAGRKASLLEGGDGRAVQHVDLQVPANRLHLVQVNGKGLARLKLRPRFELNREQRIVLIDAAPTFDHTPSLDELFRMAARNYQLERAYYDERRVDQTKHSEAGRLRLREFALGFLRDRTQRAARYPSPTPSRCYLNTPLGLTRFHVGDGDNTTRDVVREALRRFRADIAVDAERRALRRAEQDRRHEARRAAVAAWVTEHGTEEQKTWHAAGLLATREVEDALTDEAFRPLADRARYLGDGLRHLQDHARRWTGDAALVIPPSEFISKEALAHEATVAQRQHLSDFRAAVPDAHVHLHRREYVWHHGARVPRLLHVTIVVTQTVGPFALRREYLMPGQECPSVG